MICHAGSNYQSIPGDVLSTLLTDANLRGAQRRCPQPTICLQLTGDDLKNFQIEYLICKIYRKE